MADALTGQLIEQNEALKSNQKQKEIHTQRLQSNLSQQQTLDAEDKFLDTEIKRIPNFSNNIKGGEENTQVIATSNSSTPASSTHTMTDKERKAAEKAKKKQEEEARKAAVKRKADLKKELDDAKKSNQAEQLEATTLYSTGQIRLAEYNDRMAQIKEQGLQQRMDILKSMARLRARNTND